MFILVPVCPAGNCSAANYIVPIAIGGIGNSFFGAVNTPMIPLIVDNKYLNSAFGVYGSIMQLGIGVSPFVFGAILEL